MLLNVLSRPGEDGCRALRDLIAASHESAKDKAAHEARAFQLFRAQVERGIVAIVPPSERAQPWAKLRIDVDLQQNFSLDQSLSLYLLDALPLLDAESPEHALDVLTLVESILEDPDLILRKQLDMLKTERMAELKAQGVEFDQRIAELEAMEHPKPLREFIYGTFNAFAEKHPWVGGENIRPKSIAREMLEGYYTFSGFVKRYGLERSEGLLLRHLNSVYKVLANTIPEAAKTEAVREMEAFFGDLVRRVDGVERDVEEQRAGDVVLGDQPRRLAGDQMGAVALVMVLLVVAMPVVPAVADVMVLSLTSTCAGAVLPVAVSSHTPTDAVSLCPPPMVACLTVTNSFDVLPVTKSAIDRREFVFAAPFVSVPPSMVRSTSVGVPPNTATAMPPGPVTPGSSAPLRPMT